MNGSKKAGAAKRVTTRVGALTALVWLALSPLSASATSKDGIFPTAAEVGGQVYIEPAKVGSHFPTDFDVFDLSGKKVDMARLIAGKKTVVAFFITAVPVSVDGVKKLQDFARVNAPGVQVLGLNADTVGVALQSGTPVDATARTLSQYERERKMTNLYVAPNDALDPKGLSNRLGFRGLPTIFVLSADGTIEKVFVGHRDWKKGDI